MRDFIDLKAVAAPATVNGEPFSKYHWKSFREGGDQALTREPGDRPKRVTFHTCGNAREGRFAAMVALERHGRILSSFQDIPSRRIIAL